MTAWSFHDLSTIPAPHLFDIVLCRFPFVEASDVPAQRASPCLVLQVRKHASEPKAFCHVAFGTSNLKSLTRGNIDLLVNKTATMNRIGLHQATRFDLSMKKIVELPWASEWFPCPKGTVHPVIGALDAPLIEALRALIAHRCAKHIEGW